MDRAKLRTRLINKEALKLDAYPDSLGYWTACVGHLLGKEKPAESEFTLAQCCCWLELDMDTAVTGATSYNFYKHLDSPRQNVVVELVFNLGHRLLKFERFLHFMWAQDWMMAGAELKDSLAYKQEPHRFDELITALSSGDYPA